MTERDKRDLDLIRKAMDAVVHQDAMALRNVAKLCIETAREIEFDGVPYPLHCVDPNKCRHKGYCPRDPACNN